jgi:DNA-directed RNA polymerase subunit RPC12/RpoP
MVPCSRCGKRLLRVHRTVLEKWLWSDMFECPACKHREGSYHRSLYAHCRVLLSRHSRCIRCGSEGIQRLKKRDKVDGFSQNPLAILQVLIGAPVNRCSPCRLQFFDWRKPREGAHPDY